MAKKTVFKQLFAFICIAVMLLANMQLALAGASPLTVVTSEDSEINLINQPIKIKVFARDLDDDIDSLKLARIVDGQQVEKQYYYGCDGNSCGHEFTVYHNTPGTYDYIGFGRNKIGQIVANAITITVSEQQTIDSFTVRARAYDIATQNSISPFRFNVFDADLHNVESDLGEPEAVAFNIESNKVFNLEYLADGYNRDGDIAYFDEELSTCTASPCQLSSNGYTTQCSFVVANGRWDCEVLDLGDGTFPFQYKKEGSQDTIYLYNYLAEEDEPLPPVISSLPDIQFNEGSQSTTLYLDNYVEDGDTPDSQLTWTVSSDTYIQSHLDTEHRQIYFSTYSDDYRGTRTLTLTATDPEGNSDSEQITVRVNGVNDAPEMVAVANKDINEGETVEYVISAIDPDGDTLTYSYSSTLPFQKIGANTFRYTSDYDDASSSYTNYYVTFSVSDGNGGTDSEQARVRIYNVNRAPTLSSVDITPQNPDLDETLTCTAYGLNDPDTEDNPIVRYAWRLNGNVIPGQTLSTLNLNFVTEQIGDTVSCIGTPYDGKTTGGSQSDSVTIADPTAPTINSLTVNPNPATLDQQITFSASISDNHGVEDVTFDIAGNEYTHNNITHNGALHTLTVDADTIGVGNDHIFSVTAEDDSGNTASDQTTFIINEAADETAPIIHEVQADPEQAVAGQSITLRANVTDETLMGQVRVSIDQGPTYTMIHQQSGWYEFTISDAQFLLGNHLFTVTARDAANNPAEPVDAHFEMVTGIAPVINEVIIEPESVPQLSDIKIRANVTDEDGTVNGASFSVDSGTTYGLVLQTNGWWEADYFTDQMEVGEHTVTVNAQDNTALDAVPVEATFNIYGEDLEAPLISNIAATPDPVFEGENITISAEITDDASGVNDSSVYIELNGNNYPMTETANDVYQVLIDTTGFSLGLNTFTIHASDYSGKQNSANGNFTVAEEIVDTEIPVINSADAQPNPVTEGEDITFTANVTDDVAVAADTVRIQLEDTNYTMISSGNDIFTFTTSTSGLALGDYDYTIYAEDTSGKSAVPVTSSFTVEEEIQPDTTAPVFNDVNYPTGDVDVTEMMTFTANVTDDEAVDTNSVKTVLPVVGAQGMTNTVGDIYQLQLGANTMGVGKYPFYMTAQDTSGNKAVVYPGIINIVDGSVEPDDDREAPSITIKSPLNGATYNYTSIPIDISATDNAGIDTLRYSINGGAYQDYTGIVSIDFTDHYTHTMTVRAVDLSGNLAQQTITFEVDTSKNFTNGTTDLVPSVSLTANPTQGTEPLTVDFTCSVQSGDPNYNYSIEFGDGNQDGLLNTGQTSDTYSNIYNQGTYTAACTVTDSDGDLSTANREIDVGTVPGTAPIINAVLAVPDPVVQGNNVALRAVVSDVDNDMGTVTFTFNGTDYTDSFDGDPNYEHVLSTAGLAPGTYFFNVTAEDTSLLRAGPVQGNFTVIIVNGTNAPVIKNVSTNINPVVQGNNIELQALVTDADGDMGTVTFEFQGVNNTDNYDGDNNYGYTLDTTPLAPGFYVFNVYAEDLASLTDGPVQGNFTVTAASGNDTTIPQILDMYALPDPVDMGQDVTFYVNVTDNVEVDNVTAFTPNNASVALSLTSGDAQNGQYTATINTSNLLYGLIVGNNNIRVEAVDNSSNLATGWFNFDITSPGVNNSPVIVSVNATPDPVVQGNNVELQAVVTDLDGDMGTVTFQLEGANYTDNYDTDNNYARTVPTNTLTPGFYVFNVYAEDLGGLTAGPVQGNFTVAPAGNATDVDLIISTAEVIPNPIDFNNNFTVNFTITNTGTDNVTDPFLVEIQLCPPTYIGCSIPTSVQIVGIDAGQSITLESQAVTLGAGDVYNNQSYIAVIADGDANITETNEANNVYYLNTSVIDFVSNDTQAPVIHSTEAVPNPVEYGNNVELRANVTEETAMGSVTFEVEGVNQSASLDNALNLYTLNIPTTGMSLGLHYYNVYTEDAALNQAGPMQGNFTVQDTTDPVINTVMVSPNPAVLGVHNEVTVTSDVTDNYQVNTVWIEFQNQTHFATFVGGAYVYNLNISALGIGDYNITVRANDSVGREAVPANASFTITAVDNTAPTITTYAAPNPVLEGDNVTIVADVQDNVAVDTVNIEFQGTNYTTAYNGSGYIFNIDTTGFTLGLYNYTVHANDTSGNNASQPGTFTVTDSLINDTEAPVIQSTAAVPNPVEYDGNVELRANVTDNVSVDTVTIELAGVNYTANYDNIIGLYTFNTPTTGLPLGVNTYTVYANDTSSNQATPVTGNFTLQDTTAPVINVAGAAPNPAVKVVHNNIIFTADVTDNYAVDTVLFDIDGTNHTATLNAGLYEYNLDITAWSVGDYNFTIYANDTKGNNAFPYNGTFSITQNDTTGPVIVSTYATPDPVNAGDSNVMTVSEVTDNVAVDTVTIEFQSVNYTATYNGSEYIANLPTASLSLGTYNYTVQANDTAGNNAIPLDGNFTVGDLVGPSINTVTENPNPVNEGSEINFTANITDNVQVDTVWIEVEGVNHTLTPESGDMYTVNVDTTGFSLGLHNYVIYANDTSGNLAVPQPGNFMVNDGTAPIIHDTTVMNDPIEYDNNVEIRANVTDNVAVSSVTIDIEGNAYPAAFNNTFNLYVLNIPTTGLTLGLHYYNVYAEDTSLNPAGPLQGNFTVQDTTPPTINLAGAWPNPAVKLFHNATTLSAGVTDNYAVDTVWFEFNGTDYIATLNAGVYEYNLDITSLSAGDYNFTVHANDTVGLTATPLNGTFTITDTDITEPTIVSTYADPDPVAQGDVTTITSTVSDNVAVDTVLVEFQGVNNTAAFNGTQYLFNIDTTTLSLGTYNYTVYANDTSGNNATPTASNFTVVDGTAPVINSITDTPDPVNRGENISIGANVTDNTAVNSVWVEIDGVNHTLNALGSDLYAVNVDTTGMTLGIHTYIMHADDAAGNNAAAVNSTFTVVDASAPVINSVSDTPDPVPQGNNITIGANVTDDDAVNNVWVGIDGTNYTLSALGGDMYAVNIDTTGFSLGLHIYTVHANDTSGNSAVPVSGNFTVTDSSIPVIISTTAIPDPVAEGSNVTIASVVTDDIAVDTVLIEFQGVNNTAAFNGTDYLVDIDTTGIALGLHTYIVHANDTAGNNAVPLAGNFTVIDSSVPVINNITDTPDPVDLGANITISANVTDNIAVDTVRIDVEGVNHTMPTAGGDMYATNIDTTGMTLGLHTYTVYANDTSGNSAVPVSGNFTIVDSNGPVINNVTDTPDPVNQTDAVLITANVTDNVAVDTVWVEVNGTNYTTALNNGTYSVSIDTTPLAPGLYTYTVHANDTSGNLATPVSGNFTVLSTRGEVEGYVLDENSAIVPNVLVELRTQNSTILSTFTNASGHYMFNAPAASYTLRAIMPGYSVGTEPVTILQAQLVQVNITIEANEGAFNGHTANVNGSNESNVDVSVDATAYNDLSDVDGNYYIANVSVGSYNLTAAKAGLMTQQSTGHNVVDDQNTTVDFVMSPAGILTGTVYDFFGYPATIANATITISQNGVDVATVNANGVGVYTFSDVAPGLYRVTASAPGYNDQYFEPVQVFAGQTTTRNFALG